MPLFQPSNITPSSFAGVGGGTIDANDNVSITWQVNGNEPMTAFKIDIYDMNGTAVATSEIQTLSTPFYPTDNKGNPNYYIFEPNITWTTYGVSNGNEYTLQITQYWGNSTSSSNTITQISQSAFIAREKPTLIITGLPSVGTAVQSVSLPIAATFVQANGDSIEWVRWQFYQTDENGENAVLQDDTGVVNTQVLSYTLDNMFNGNDYKIICTAQSENGVQVTAEQYFAVSYELPNISGQFSVDCSDKMSNLLSWKDIEVEEGDSIKGTPSGSYSFNNGNLVLSNNSSVAWEKVVDSETQSESQLNIGTPWTLAWKGSSNALNYSSQIDNVNVNSFYQLINIVLQATSQELDKSIDKIVYCRTNGFYYGISKAYKGYDIYLIKINQGQITVLPVYTFSYETTQDIDISPSGNTLVVACGRLSDMGGVYFFSINNDGNLSDVSKIYNGGQTAAVKFLDDYSIACYSKVHQSPAWNGIIMCIKTSGETYYELSLGGGGVTSGAFLMSTISVNGGNKQGYSSGLFSVCCQMSTGSTNPDGCYMFSYSNTSTSNTVTQLFTPNNFADSGDYAYDFIAMFSPINNNFIAANRVYNISSSNQIEYIGTLDGLTQLISFDETGTIIVYQTSNGLIQKCIYNNQLYDEKAISFGNESSTPLLLKNNISICKDDNSLKAYSYNTSCYFSYSKDGYSNVYTALIKSITTVSSYDIISTLIGYSLSGETTVPQTITATVDVISYNLTTSFPNKNGNVYLQVGDWLTVKQNIIELQFIVNENTLASFDISPNTTQVLFSINANSITVYFNGETTGTTQSISITQQPITSIQLIGEQTTSWVVVENGTKAIPSNYNPIWSTENGTQFLTNFGLNSLEAGQLSIAEPELEIYRENLQTGEVKKIIKTNLYTNQFRDYSWITGEQYKYTAYALLTKLTSSVYTGVQDFSPYPICKRQNFYLLLETMQDKAQPNVYHVVNSWRFGANIEAGSVSNNNQPNFLTNFTPYRTKQPTTRNSESGTLTALLSNVQNGKYADTVEQMKALKAISNSLNTFFLKDMKGDLLLVSIAGAITKKVNTKSSVQETTISIPWEETGSADGVSIIQTPEDNGWVGSNDIANVRLATKIDGDNITQELGLPDGVTVDFIDGQLYVNYPDGYQGTTFSLDENGNLVATTPEQQQQPSLYLANGTVKLKAEN